jgi:hypothetical protein
MLEIVQDNRTSQHPAQNKSFNYEITDILIDIFALLFFVFSRAAKPCSHKTLRLPFFIVYLLNIGSRAINNHLFKFTTHIYKKISRKVRIFRSFYHTSAHLFGFKNY